MKVIITDSFNKKFLSKMKKYFSTNDFVLELKKEKPDIVLKEPIHKVKLKLNLVDFRWVILILFEDNIVPLLLFLKKNKQNWENIIWNTHKDKILDMQEKVSRDLENWNYKIF